MILDVIKQVLKIKSDNEDVMSAREDMLVWLVHDSNLGYARINKFNKLLKANNLDEIVL